MADSKKIKSRIDEIRNRVLNTPSKHLEKIGLSDIIFENDAIIEESVELDINNIKPSLIKDENFNSQLNTEIKNQFEALDAKFNKILHGFELKIPDIEKGSRLRTQLDSEIGDIISQRLSTYLEALSEQIQQSRTLNRTIEDQSENYASANDLSDLKKGLEEVYESNTNIKLEEIKSSMQNALAKITLDFASKNSALEENLFQKVEHGFEESVKKLNALEGIVTDSITRSSKASDAVKKDLEIRLVESLAKLEEFNLYSK